MTSKRRVFIGSSSEALKKAAQIAKLLHDSCEIEAEIWNQAFKPGFLTFQAIEERSRRISGAIFLASPDDISKIRRKTLRVPRTNVMIEFGYMAAILGRDRVALCRYDDTYLATDLAGFTYIPMGPFDTGRKEVVDANAMPILLGWARALPQGAPGFTFNQVVHGFTGSWDLRMTFQRWRQIDLTTSTDYVEFIGRMDICVPRDGFNGMGSVHGDLTIVVRDCKAQFKVADKISGIQCQADGSVLFSSTMHNRQKVYIEGPEPQADGFKEELLGPFFYNWTLSPGKDGEFDGEYVARAGHTERSRATVSARKTHREAGV